VTTVYADAAGARLGQVITLDGDRAACAANVQWATGNQHIMRLASA
jgi:hypothetical protein